MVADDRRSGDVRQIVTEVGVKHLAVTDLVAADLERIAWSGGPSHIREVARQLDRVAGGDSEYLAVRAPDGSPIAKGGIDSTQDPGVGTIWQVATRDDVRGLGIATRLIHAAEHRIRTRGLTKAKLSVGVDNTHALLLYERLGYVAQGERRSSWEADREDGSTYTKETVLTDMEKNLEHPPPRTT
jgi:ribosomal protein S18 acetylase RimI-like enzyme